MAVGAVQHPFRVGLGIFVIRVVSAMMAALPIAVMPMPVMPIAVVDAPTRAQELFQQMV